MATATCRRPKKLFVVTIGLRGTRASETKKAEHVGLLGENRRQFLFGVRCSRSCFVRRVAFLATLLCKLSQGQCANPKHHPKTTNNEIKVHFKICEKSKQTACSEKWYSSDAAFFSAMEMLCGFGCGKGRLIPNWRKWSQKGAKSDQNWAKRVPKWDKGPPKTPPVEQDRKREEKGTSP